MTSARLDRKSTRLNSSHRCISYAVFCLKKRVQIGKEDEQTVGLSASLQVRQQPGGAQPRPLFPRRQDEEGCAVQMGEEHEQFFFNELGPQKNHPLSRIRPFPV